MRKLDHLRNSIRASVVKGNAVLPDTTHLVIVIIVLITACTIPAAAHGSDRDGDGLADHEEWEYNTEKDVRDTDNDGLIDGVEVYATNTDPTDPDTDGDGFTDGEEDRLGSDPTDPEDTPGPLGPDYT